jgi:hypothetical protein
MRIDMKLKEFSGLIAIFASAVILAGCQSRTTNGISGSPIVSWGTMKKGSVIVNGVTFAVSGAQITDSDVPIDEAQLQDGLMIKVRGRLNSDSVTGTAEKVKTASEVVGSITATGADSIFVLGQQIFIDSRTVFGNGLSIQALAVDQRVGVHGIWDQQGKLLATRIELPAAGGPPPDSAIKGVVEAPFTPGNPPTLTFMLRGLTVVTTSETAVRPAGTTINLGDPVEVFAISSLSGTTFTAGRIDREDLEDAEFEPQEGEHFEMEGFVSDFTALNADFTLGGITTRLTGTARFEGGIAADQVNNMRVEAEGRISGGILMADKIKFHDTVRIEANADAVGSADVLGKTVVITSRTDLANLAGGVGGIALGQGLKVRGFANSDGSITATRIEELGNSVAANQIVIQGVVESFNVPAGTVAVLGITTNAAEAAEVELDNQIITLDQFFSQLTVGKTVVKVRGLFSAGPPPTLTADKVAIE